MRSSDELIMFSSEAGIGRDELWALINRHIHHESMDQEGI